jgi:hypothetical protein
MPEPTLTPAIHPQLRSLLPEDGPTLDEVKARQRPENEVAEYLRGSLEFVADEYATKVTFREAEHFATHVLHSTTLAAKIAVAERATIYLTAIYEGTKTAFELSVHKPMERGEEFAEARLRDGKNLALLMAVQGTAADALPDGYFQSEVSRVLGTDGRANLFSSTPFKSASMLLAKASTDPEAARSRDILVASLREGVSTAYQLGLGSDDAVAKLKSTDKQFATRYESDPAFRDGIKSVVWQAKIHPDEYQQVVALNAPRPQSSRM